MLYYRRKPLDGLSVETPAAEAERLATEFPNPAASGKPESAAGPPSAIDDIAPALPRLLRRESGLPAAGSDALPASVSAPLPDRSGADLVARAVEILNQDLASGALAAASAAPFQSILPMLNFGSLPTAGSLPAAFGETLNGLLQSVQMQSPTGNGPVPAAAPLAAAWGGPAMPGLEEAVPLQPAGTARTGEQAAILFKLHNDSFRPVEIVLQAAELTSPYGHTIPQSAITITPQTLSLAPDSVAEIMITILIPAAAPAAVYSGPLTAAALPYLQGLLQVKVE